MLILQINLDDTEYIHIFYDGELSICIAIFKLFEKIFYYLSVTEC